MNSKQNNGDKPQQSNLLSRWFAHPTGRRVIVCSAILLFGLCAAAILYTMKPHPKKRSGGELVRSLKAIPIKLGDVKLHVSGYGTVKPKNVILISSQSRGIIMAKHPRMAVGLVVKRGELLAQIDSTDAKLQLERAIAEINRLQNEWEINQQTIADAKQEIDFEKKVTELERSNYERQQKLFKKKITSRSNLERAERALTEQMRKYILLKGKLRRLQLNSAAIKASLEKAKASRDQAKVDIQRCTIVSPIHGRLKTAFVENGEFVQPGQKLLSIADDANLEITVSISAFDIVKAMGLRKASLSNYRNWFKEPDGSIPVKISWTEAENSCAWSGRITNIRKFDEVTRTLEITVKPIAPLPSNKSQIPLVDGMFCKVTFTGKTLHHAMQIPWAAVQLDGNVFTIDRHGILQRHKIDIYSVNDDKVTVTGGLPEGEMLVVQPLPRGVITGSRVKAVPYHPSPELNSKP